MKCKRALHKPLPKVPSVLVVIVNYNHAKCLEGLMNSVFATEYPNFRVVLLDNASSDNSREIIKTFKDQRLRVVLLPENVGLCKARNLGASSSESSYFAFLDPDVIVTTMWLQRLVDTMESDLTLGIAESTITSQIPWAASSKERVKLFALGTAFIIRNSVWHQLGGFDDDYFVGYEDVDLGWRTWLLGYKVVGTTNSLVYHVGGLLRKGNLRNVFRYNDFKNRLSALITNLEFSSLLYETPRIIYSIAYFFVRDLKGGQINVILSLFYIFKNQSKLLRKRVYIQGSRRIKDKDIKTLWDPSARDTLHRSGRYLWYW